MKRIIAGSLLFLLPVAALPQRDTIPIFSLEDVYRHNYWLTSGNPISLSLNSFHSFSIAQAGFSYSKGNPDSPAFPASTDRYSMDCQSFQQIGKISLYGKLSYSLNKERQVSLNGMTNCYWQAVNLYDSVSGNRQSETYRLAGGVSLPLNKHWLIGARADYNVEQTAKNTDPRHKNQWMTWQLTPGISYLRGKTRLGASLYYSVKKEEIDYRNMGNHRDYPILIGYPLGYNKSLPQKESAPWYYTGQETGGSVQIDIPLRRLRFFQQIQNIASHQKVMSNRIQNRKEADTDGWQITYKGHLLRQTLHIRQEWNAYIMYNRFKNYDPLQDQTAAGTWQSYGEVLRSSRQTETYSFRYKYERLNEEQYPSFTFTSGIIYCKTGASLFFYPTEYTQSHHNVTLHSTVTRTFFLKRGHLKLALSGHYQTNARWGVTPSLTYTCTRPLSWFVKLSGAYVSPYTKIGTQFGWLF